MILKYRTSPLTNPPQTSWNYIDSITHFSSFYNPITSALTVNLITHFSSIPTTLILNDLAYLLTDEGILLDKVYNPYSKYQNSNDFHEYPPNYPHQNYPNQGNNFSYGPQQSSQFYHKKPYRKYNKPHYYKHKPNQPNQNLESNSFDTSFDTQNKSENTEE